MAGWLGFRIMDQIILVHLKGNCRTHSLLLLLLIIPHALVLQKANQNQTMTKCFLSIFILSIVLNTINSYFYRAGNFKKIITYRSSCKQQSTLLLLVHTKKISEEEWNKIKQVIDTNPDEWKSALV